MNKIFEYTATGASIGSAVGTALGALFGTGATIALAPVALPTLCLLAGTACIAGGLSAGTIGALTGGTIGATVGTVETIHDCKQEHK